MRRNLPSFSSPKSYESESEEDAADSQLSKSKLKVTPTTNAVVVSQALLPPKPVLLQKAIPIIPIIDRSASPELLGEEEEEVDEIIIPARKTWSLSSLVALKKDEQPVSKHQQQVSLLPEVNNKQKAQYYESERCTEVQPELGDEDEITNIEDDEVSKQGEAVLVIAPTQFAIEASQFVLPTQFGEPSQFISDYEPFAAPIAPTQLPDFDDEEESKHFRVLKTRPTFLVKAPPNSTNLEEKAFYNHHHHVVSFLTPPPKPNPAITSFSCHDEVHDDDDDGLETLNPLSNELNRKALQHSKHCHPPLSTTTITLKKKEKKGVKHVISEDVVEADDDRDTMFTRRISVPPTTSVSKKRVSNARASLGTPSMLNFIQKRPKGGNEEEAWMPRLSKTKKI